MCGDGDPRMGEKHPYLLASMNGKPSRQIYSIYKTVEGFEKKSCPVISLSLLFPINRTLPIPKRPYLY